MQKIASILQNIANRLVAYNSASSNKNKRQKGRTCRIEELEGREMLSVTPWSLADDYSDIPANLDAETLETAPFSENELSPLADAPTGFKTTGQNASSVSLSWNSVASAQAYQVQWRPVGGSWTTRTQTQSTSDTVTGLIPNTVRYEFQVRVRVGGAWNEWSTSVFSNQIEQPPEVPTFSAQPQSATYTQGQTATVLSVTASGNGTLSYQWYRDGGGTITGATTRTYTPPTTTVGTVGYYCIVTNTLNGSSRTAQSNTATITVNAPSPEANTPTISVQPQSATYTQGQTAIALFVTASGNGTLTYQWYGSSSATVLSSSQTYIPPTSTIGSLGYYCVVTNTLNGTSKTATSTTATIAVTPIADDLPDLAVSNGGTATPNPATKDDPFSVTSGTIKNEGTAASGGYTITFYASTNSSGIFSSGNINLGSVSKSGLAVGETATATLSGISTTGLAVGTYYIGWEITGGGDTNTANNRGTGITLTVNEQKQQLATPENLDAIRKFCTATQWYMQWDKVENAISYEVRWIRNVAGVATGDYGVGRIDIPPYMIFGLSGGNYFVQVRAIGDGINYRDSEWSESFTFPEGGTPGDWEKLSPSAMELGYRTNTMLGIKWTGDTRADEFLILWALDKADIEGNKVQPKSKSTALIYDIADLEPGTTYYVCVMGGCNGFQPTDWSDIEEFTTGDDDYNLTVTEETEDSMTLKWDSVPSAINYDIQYRKGGTTTWTTIFSISETSCQVGSLDSGTKYEFQVCGSTTDEKFVWSESAFGTTKGESDVAPPVLLEISNTTSSITLGWSSVPGAKSYEISYRQRGTTAWTNIDSISGTSRTIGGLSANTWYDFRICVQMDAGNSTWSMPLSIRTPVSVSVSGDEPGSNYIPVTCDSLPDGARWIQYKASTSSAWMTWYTPATPTSLTTITGLKSETSYEFRFVNVCGEPVGTPWSKTTLAPTKWDACDCSAVKPKATVDKKAATINSVTLCLPAHVGQNAVYVINVVQIGNVKDSTKFPDNFIKSYTVNVADLEHVKVGNTMMARVVLPPCLMSNTSYKFSVMALNFHGEAATNKKGKVASVVNVTAKTAKYAAVKNLKATVSAADENINLSWTPHPNPATTGYEVWALMKVGNITTEVLVDTIYGVGTSSASVAISTLLETVDTAGFYTSKSWKSTLQVRAIGEYEGHAVQSLFAKKSVTIKKTVVPVTLASQQH